ncbi:nucleoside-diphosphate sugar epimerase/dehydratase [Mediterraneibacter gnavus]|uniref:nucleoside-diphosphate sugar epimerase/dehydratase n=1 Tax=Mediterraneibacter gnavus TaxID=33038 RepID=UPI001184D401|nr:nucleoside-diphosphate sugar epimerase/dehydratase [Mediterraneibacter gnavus]
MKNKVEHWQVVSIGLVVYDTIAVTLAFFLALWFRFDCRYTMIPSEYLSAYYKFLLIYVVFSIFVFWRMRLYNSIWRFASYSELLRTIVATGITFVFHCIGITVLFGRMPLSYYVFGIMIQFALTLGVRFSYRFVLLERSRQRKSEEIAKAKRVLLIGAGKAGQMILRDIKTAKELKDIVCCIIDDNPNKWGRYVEGVPVIGGRDDILSAVDRFKIEKIVLAVPSASAQEKRDILNICKETGCELKNLPGIYQFLTGEVRVSALKDVAVEDLLGRDPIRVNMEEIYSFIQGKKVLVTGGGGSIGSGLCRQIASYHPKQLIILDIYENNAYDIQQELKKNYPELDLVVLIGSVRDSRRINAVFESYRPDVVYHAAAHKHVPLMEDSPCESIKNNVIGTYKTAYAAMMNGCQRFVLISTDKAVNPTNIMGASKRLCEMIVQSFDRMVKEKIPEKLPILYAHADDEDGAMVKKQILSGDIHTEFVAVRFGNVLGSNGSVIPLFKKQIAAGGPVTVTHPDIIRYFMTIPEAVSLVLQAGTYAKGGEIFVLDMGSPVKIDTLARNLIKLSGLKPDVDIRVEYTGLRPGEKLYEEKLMAEEGLKKTPNSLIHVGCPIPFETDVFLEQMQSLMEAAYTNDEHIREKVAEIVTTYHPAGKNGSEEKGEVYERLLDQSAKTQELRQQKRNQILSEGQ